MTRRTVATGVVASVSAIALAVAAAVAASLGGGSPPAGHASLYRGSEVPAGIAMPDFSLRNYDGRRVRTSDLRGHVTLVTFLDSQCTESCPVIAWTVARAIDALTPAERKDVRAVGISTDPAEDARATVRKFLARNRAVGRLLYVGGGQLENELRSVWKSFYVLASLDSGQDSLHSAPVRIYDSRGTWVTSLHAGVDLDEANLLHDIRGALR